MSTSTTSSNPEKMLSHQRQRKEAMLAAFEQDCKDAEGIFIAQYTGIDVSAISKLRAEAKNAGGQMRVVKNSVAKIALSADKRFAPLVEHLSGHLIYASATTAPAIAKVLSNFAKEHEELVIKAGAMDGELLEKEQIKRLADLPSREEMLGIVAGTLNAPIVKLARTLADVSASLARVLVAVRDAKSTSTNG